MRLDGRPAGEVVAVRGGDRAVAEEVSVGMEEDGIRRDLAHAAEQLALVEREKTERLPQLDAPGEHEGVGGRPHQSSRSRRDPTLEILSGRPLDGLTGRRFAAGGRSGLTSAEGAREPAEQRV